jgi:hypothetical protein
MISNLGTLEIECVAPAYEIVQACQWLGFVAVAVAILPGGGEGKKLYLRPCPARCKEIPIRPALSA